MTYLRYRLFAAQFGLNTRQSRFYLRSKRHTRDTLDTGNVEQE